MALRKAKQLKTVFSAKAADGVGTSIDTPDFRHVFVQLATASSANMTIKIQGSLSPTKPDFSAARSATNHWDYIAVADLEDGSILDGDTGLALTGTDEIRNLEVNTDGVFYINAEISSYVAGNATVKVMGMQD